MVWPHLCQILICVKGLNILSSKRRQRTRCKIHNCNMCKNCVCDLSHPFACRLLPRESHPSLHTADSRELEEEQSGCQTRECKIWLSVTPQTEPLELINTLRNLDGNNTDRTHFICLFIYFLCKNRAYSINVHTFLCKICLMI